MHKDLLKPLRCMDRVELNKRLHSPMKKFNKSEVLIRSIDDTDYPNNTLLEKNFIGYFKAEVYDFCHNGIQIIIGVKDIKVKQYKDSNNDKFTASVITVLEIGCLHKIFKYENIYKNMRISNIFRRNLRVLKEKVVHGR